MTFGILTFIESYIIVRTICEKCPEMIRLIFYWCSEKIKMSIGNHQKIKNYKKGQANEILKHEFTSITQISLTFKMKRNSPQTETYE